MADMSVGWKEVLRADKKVASMAVWRAVWKGVSLVDSSVHTQVLLWAD